jgi:hypothetical protein
VNNGLHLATMLGLTTGAGLLMFVSGTKKRMLRWKVERRRCAACRRDMRHCGCGR